MSRPGGIHIQDSRLCIASSSLCTAETRTASENVSEAFGLFFYNQIIFKLGEHLLEQTAFYLMLESR